MIELAIRFDDPSACSDHALERELLRVMAKHGIRATFAVIPHAGSAALAADRAHHLLEAARAGVVEIAQHGFRHESRAPNNAIPTEFAGARPSEQAEKIGAGRAILESVFGVPIRGFVPPFNTFDEATAATLCAQHFHYLSAGAEHGALTRGVALVPRTCQVMDLKLAIAEARQRSGKRLAVVAVMHHYDLAESGNREAPLTMEKLSDLFCWLRQQADVRLNTLIELAQRHDADTWQKAVRRSRWAQRRHWRIQRLFPKHCLMLQPLFNYPRLKAKQP